MTTITQPANRPAMKYSLTDTGRGSGTSTPWGRAQSSQKFGPGVTLYTTAGHGGFKVSPTRNVKIHEAWRDPQGWYEEDCEWAFVALTFPEFFSASEITYAHESVGRWYPEQYKLAWPHCAHCGRPCITGFVTRIELYADKDATFLHRECEKLRCGYCTGRGYTRNGTDDPCGHCAGSGRAA